MKKNGATILIVVGIALIGFAIGLNNQIEGKQVKISHAEGQMSNPRPLRPLRNSIAEQSNASIQERIDNGIQAISNQEELVVWMEIAGVVCLILGIGNLIKRRRSRK